ncbi:hypothetical protein SNE40_003743 [Patella caerulea]|uniref:BHLH domain-containing protein n=1 Tax=Patella caerulea TaxID=87958 RepID=A0AAN8KC13_PATCE
MAVDDFKTLSSPKGMADGDEAHLGHRQTIHSGHFMVSRVHDHEGNDDFDDDEAEQIDDAFDFVTASKETSKTYTFGPRSTHTLAIDASLTKLFECMTLAYSGTITSPKWKAFRGMHVTVKDKIRLNNIIWREWHMQYIYHRSPIICDFSTPLSDDIHSKPEAVVLEGKYWKRRLDTVTAEYKKWRKYFKERISRKPPDSTQNLQETVSIAELLERVKSTNVLPRSSQVTAATDLMMTGEFMEMDFTDNFFASLNQPFAFPNPREFSQISCADLIQPGLIQLQPNLDEFMDIDEILGTKNQIIYTSSSGIEASHTQPINNSAINMTMSVLDGTYDQGNNNMNYRPDTIDVSSLLDNPSLMENMANYVSQLYNKTPVKGSSTGSTFPTVQNTQTTPTTVTQSMGVISHGSPAKTGRRRNHASPSSTITSATTNQKKDGFAVPKKPVHRSKQRTIAPAPSTSPTRGTAISPTRGTAVSQGLPQLSSSSTSPSVQSTYLAQLLTKGTYPGALINVKSEPQSSACLSDSPSTTSTLQPLHGGTSTLQPLHGGTINLTQDTPLPINIDFSKVPNDFSTSVVVAAASQALGTSPANVQTFSSSTNSSFAAFLNNPTSSPPETSQPTSPSTFPSSSPSTICDTLSPSNSPGMCSPLRDEEKGPFNEHRRAAHLSAEQKRRCNLKNGFDTLVVLVPALAQNPKASKADMLRKTAEFCKKLKAERSQMQKEAEILRQEIEVLNNSISMVQSQLPETGVPVTRQRVDQMKEMFEEYVKNRTLQNWKFWIVSFLYSCI